MTDLSDGLTRVSRGGLGGVRVFRQPGGADAAAVGSGGDGAGEKWDPVCLVREGHVSGPG